MSNVLLINPSSEPDDPGAELYKECLEAGFKEPETLHEWADFNPKESDFHWIQSPELIKTLREYFSIYNAGKHKSKRIYGLPLALLSKMAKLRFEHDFWSIKMEPWAANSVKGKLKWKG